MPYETRRISLSEDELFHAVQLFRLDHPEELPSGDLVAVQIRDGRVEATLRPGRASPARHVATLSPALGVRALVNFCLDQQIPLPRQSAKTFGVEDGRATLVIELATGRAAEAARVSAHAQHHHDRRERPDRGAGPEDAREALVAFMLAIETRPDGA